MIFGNSLSTNGLVCSSTSQTGVATTFAYDAFQREVSQTDGRGNTTHTVYDNLGRVTSTIDALGYATDYGYDALGRQISVTDPLTNTVCIAYDSEGHVVSQRGATYPVDYSYDEFGDKVSMTTYRDINAAGDVTRWLRDEATGLVTNKVYADGKGPRYAYTPDGKLATRTWARGIVTTYSYDDNGDLTNTVYSDGTPTISLAYNRAGRQVRAEDAAGVTAFLYDDFGSLTNETVRSDDALVVVTNTIERYYDSFGRSLGYSLNGVRQSTLAYDPATGRLASMLAAGSDTPFTWSYLPGSDLKSSLSYPNGLTASWQYDANDQLLQVRNAFPTNTISQYDYVYDVARRRISVSKSGTAFDQGDTISYGYNEKSELTNAVASVDSDYRYSYDFDEIGNRETSSERGTNFVYAANQLNQYVVVDNFTPQFDDDGNQTLVKTATGVWQVSYNGENRPILWTQGTNTIAMCFDRMGRRVTKNNQRFVYAGYLQIADNSGNVYIWDPTENIATRPLVWNSSTFQLFHPSTSYYTHDGNKNVSEVIVADGAFAAHYEYTPFGAQIVSRGTFAATNPWRYSCEYAEDDMATIYYNYRHYEPVIGRWMSRDPVGEVASLNINAFLANKGILCTDRMGLFLGASSLVAYYLSTFLSPDSPLHPLRNPRQCKKGQTVSAFADYGWFSLENRAINIMKQFHSQGKEIAFRSPKDLATQIDALVSQCDCIRDFYVIAHGYSQRRSGEANSNSVSIHFQMGPNYIDNDLWEGDTDESISDYFGSLSGKFCKDCHITLYSCALGQNPFLKDRLMRKTGCKITLFKWNIWSLTGGDFLDRLWNGDVDIPTPNPNIPVIGMPGLY